MADDKPTPREFPVEVAVGGIRVTVTLLLKPGTEVSVVGQETKEQRSDGDDRQKPMRSMHFFGKRTGKPSP